MKYRGRGRTDYLLRSTINRVKFPHRSKAFLHWSALVEDFKDEHGERWRDVRHAKREADNEEVRAEIMKPDLRGCKWLSGSEEK